MHPAGQKILDHLEENRDWYQQNIPSHSPAHGKTEEETGGDSPTQVVPNPAAENEDIDELSEEEEDS